MTLAGAGGSGKTRLAIQVAAQVATDYDDGVTFVSLASTKNPERVINAVAQELNVLDLPDRSLEETLGRFLARKQKLLILDNFEHVLEAALLVSRLMRAAPQLTVLVTSREALRLYGEHAYVVPPLALPDLAGDGSLSALAAVDALNLFVQRAHMVAHDFALTEDNAATVAAICRRLDGLPLAIELAAARIKLFSPHDLLQKLDDLLGLLVDGPRDMPQRQRTLRATIEWSFNLLSPQEQQLLAQLAVFNGGCTLAASEAVCACGKGHQLLLALESLLNKNLLFQKPGPSDEQRFYMLETIHEYARERLRAGGEERLIGNRHLDYYLDLVEEMAPGYMRQGQLALFKRTGEEIDNIRNAFTWALSGEQIEKAARLLTAVNYYLRYHSKYVLEGYRLSKQLLPNICWTTSGGC